jgi:D-xylulose kinase
MSEDCFLAIDAGTSGCRAVVYSPTGEILASAYHEFPSEFPRPNWVEQNALDWWEAICASTKEVTAKLESDSDLAAVGITNQRETFVAVDSDGKPLRPALVWQDRRSIDQCAWLESEVGSEHIYDLTGLTVDPYFTGPKLLWLKNNEPEVFESADKFLLVHDYIIYKLTGKTVTDYSNASRTMLFELGKRRWSEELLDKLGIPDSKLPEVLPSGSFVGELTTSAANDTGLPPEVHVYTGGGDQQCAALGCGVIKPGRVKATTGTGSFVLAYSDEVRLDKPQRRVLCSAHVLEGACIIEASIFTTGAAYRWLRNNFAKELLGISEPDPYDVLNTEAESSESGARGVTFIPHLAGAGAPHWDPSAVGIIHGLSLGHTRGDIVRAMMEGTAVEIRKNLEVMKSMNLPIADLRVTGGGARSELWCQIQSNFCALPVLRPPTEDATALGAAILASTGAKIHKNIEEAVEAMVGKPTVLEPEGDKSEVYNKVYERSVKLYNAIK